MATWPDNTALLLPDATVDLQLHTRYSDGQWTPADLFDHLAGRGFHVVAVTDHDTLAHVDPCVVEGARHGIHVIPATEVTTMWRGLPAHLLCYAERFEGDALARLIAATADGQLANTRAVSAELLRRGYHFPRQAAVLAERGGDVVRPIDNATLLHAHGYAPTMDAALASIAEAGYRQITAPLDEAVRAAHDSGAVAVLAHPGRGGGELHRYELDELAALLDDVPLDGIEVRYPVHSAEDVAAYSALARARGLLMGAGSDSHGPDGRLPIAYRADECAALLARCGVRVG